MSGNSTVDCYSYLQPNLDIVGIGVWPGIVVSHWHVKMRISVYVQCFSCIALLCFPTAHDLIKSSFRASVLTMYAIGFAFFMAHHTGSYSLQSVLVAHSFVDILLLSGFSLLCFRPILRNWKHYILLAGGVPFAIWTFVQAGTRKTDCYDKLQFKTVNVDLHTFQLYKGFWAVSGIVYALSMPSLILIWKSCTSNRSSLVWLAVVSWFLAMVSTVVVSEIIMTTFYFADPSASLTALQTTEWSFGQVFAVVMLFFVVWDIVSYPFEQGTEGTTKLRHWWGGFKTRHPRITMLRGGCFFLTWLMVLGFSSNVPTDQETTEMEGVNSEQVHGIKGSAEDGTDISVKIVDLEKQQ